MPSRRARRGPRSRLYASARPLELGDSATAATVPQISIAERGIILFALLALVSIGLFGTLAALLFILASGLLFVSDPVAGIRALGKSLPFFLLPLLAIVSTIWSDAPERTMRAGLELLLTCGAATMIAWRAPERALLSGLFVGFVLACLPAAPDIPQTLASGLALHGPYGSKNALGFQAQILFALSLAVSLDRRQFAALRLLALFAGLYAFGLVVLSKSGGATTTTALTIVLLPALVLFSKLGKTARMWMLVPLAVAIAAAYLLQPMIEAHLNALRASALDKDVTLTGRTYLWQVARQIVAERPWLGHGYYAFWRIGNIDAEALWRWGGIQSRTGFNFHNAFIEMKVDLGLVGFALLVGSCLTIGIVGALRHLVRPTLGSAFFLTMQAAIYARSLVETGLVEPFSPTTMLWMMASVYAFRMRSGESGAEMRPARSARAPVRLRTG